MRVLLVAVSAMLAGLGLTEQARSCSMPPQLNPIEPRAVVGEADAIFTGTLVAVRPKDARQQVMPAPTIFTFAVDEWVRGGPGGTIDVVSTPVGSGCGGLDATIGMRGSFLLYARTGEWGPWGVSPISPELLRDGLLPWPEPNGVGRPAFVAGGSFGRVRTALLDERGRTLAYGDGRGSVTALSICPGGRASAELVRRGESVRFALRAVPSMRVLEEVELRPSGFGENVICRSRDGSDVLASVVLYGRSSPETHLIRITSIGTRLVAAAPSLSFAIRGNRAYVSLSDGRLVVRNLVSGARRTLPGVHVPLRALSVSPNESHVAGYTGETLLTVVDLARRSRAQMPWSGGPGQTRWLGRTTLAAWSRGDGGIQIVDQALRPVRVPWEWKAHTTTVGEGGVFGVDWTGRFLTERSGSVVPLGTLFSPAVSVLEPLARR